MTTLIRVLKLVRRLHLSPKTTISRRNTLKNATFQRLLHSRSSSFTNQQYQFTTVTHNQAQENQEISEDHKMINLFQHEIQKYGRLRKCDVDKLLEDVKESGVITNLQGLFLLQCCSEVISNKSALLRRVLASEIWKTLKELNVDLDVSHYNALLNVYVETDHQYSPKDFLEEMVNAGIKPNRVTFQKLIAKYCNEGQISEASQMLNHVKSEGISDNEDMMSSLVYGHFMNNNDEAAFDIIKNMEKNGTLPTIKTYSTLLYIYANRGEIDNVKKTVKECEAKGVWVPDKVFLRIVHNLSLHGFSQHVDEILQLTPRSNAYLREATKIIYKLIEKHHYETAFKVYETLPKYRTIIGGNNFLQALINTNAPLEKSIEYCRLMEVEKLNPRAFLTVVQKSIANDMYQSSIGLLNAWKELGGKIRASYFYPILKAHGKAGQHEEIINVLQKMISEFQLQPNIYFLANSVLPYMQCDDDEMLPLLLSCQVNNVSATNAVLIHLLKRNDIRKAAQFLSNFPSFYKVEEVKSSLLNAFKNTEDVPSFVSIVHHLYMLQLIAEKNIAEDSIRKTYCQGFVDSFISETVDCILSKNEQCAASVAINKYLILALFRNLINKGLSLSPAVVDDIKVKLSDKMTPQIYKALITLKSVDLVPKPVKRESQTVSFGKKLTYIEKWESLAKLLSVRDMKKSLIYKKKLLYYYCYVLNYEKMHELLEELHLNRVEISASQYASVIDAFLRMNKIEEAEFWLIRATGLVPDFCMSKIILLKLATAIAEQGHFARALHCLNQPTLSSNYPLLVTCAKFLTAVMQFDDENYLLQAFDVLTENDYITKLDNHLLTPLVLLYLQRGDNKTALEKFDWIYKVYSLAPCQIQLMKAFIKAGDEISLNRVKTISIKVNGSMVCYFSLAVAYLENSQPDKAKEILEKYVPYLPESSVFEQAVFYCNNGQINNLENFFEILNDLNYDVEKLCVVMLKAFGYYNKWEKGYKLWMKMQRENIKPSNAFFDYLNLVMNKKDNANSILQEFSEALEGNDELKARELLEKLPLLYKSDAYSRLCKKACKSENFSNVIELCKDLRNRFNLDISSFDAEFILDKMVRCKDVASIEKMGMYMGQELKNQVRYSFYLNRAYLISGSWNLYLKDIEKRLEEGTLNWFNLNMHVKTAVESLFRHPELLEQYESIAHMCNEKNIPGLIHILWIYYFFNGDLKAEILWSQYIKNSEISIWLEVKSFQRTTPSAYVKIAKLLEDSALKDSIKLNAFASLIDLSLKSENPNKYEIGLQCLWHGTRKLPMESYDINLLVNLQTGLENSGIRWPWSRRFDEVYEKQQVKNVVDAIMKLYE